MGDVRLSSSATELCLCGASNVIVAHAGQHGIGRAGEDCEPVPDELCPRDAGEWAVDQMSVGPGRMARTHVERG